MPHSPPTPPDDVRALHAQATLGRVAIGLVHDLATPLGALASGHDVIGRTLHRLRAHAGGDREAVALLDALAPVLATGDAAVARMRDLVGGLRDLARRGAAPSLAREPVDLVAVLDTALALVGHELGDGRIDVRREHRSAPPVRGDAGALGRAFVNVLVNACHAITGRGTITVRTGARDGGASAVVEVHDTGAGIAPDVLPHVFDPGFTTRPPGAGSGLGLAIVHDVVAHHGGRVEIDSAPGAGTTVRLVLAADVAPDATGRKTT